jgi:TolB-like protein
VPRSLPPLVLPCLLLATAALAQAPVVPGVSEAPAAGQEAPAASVTAEPRKESLIVAVLTLESNESARDSAPGVTSLIASRLAESPRLRVLSQRDIETVLDAERQRQLLGIKTCDRGPCLQELSSITGARYIVTGRLDRFGDQYLLTASLVDTVEGRSLARPRADASEADALLRTAVAVADQLVATLVAPGELSTARPLLGGPRTGGGGLALGLRINNNFIDNLATLNPGMDVEVGYWFHPEWVGFAQLGFTYVRSNTEGAKGGLNVLPSVVGARHYHNVERPLRPYWGFGLGVQLSFGDFGIFQSTGPLPTVVGFAGLEYLIAGHVGLQLEAGTNVAQAVLGLADSQLGDGLNLDLNAGITYHF